MLASGIDTIPNPPRSIPPSSSLKFYFTAGSDEEKYEPEHGTANLVAATEKFANLLRNKKHTVAAHPVDQGNQETRNVQVVSSGAHTPITCMKSTPAALMFTHPPHHLVAEFSKNTTTNNVDAKKIDFKQLQAGYKSVTPLQETNGNDAESKKPETLNASSLVSPDKSSTLKPPESNDSSSVSTDKTPTLKK
jgi:hypothetical protein